MGAAKKRKPEPDAPQLVCEHCGYDGSGRMKNGEPVIGDFRWTEMVMVWRTIVLNDDGLPDLSPGEDGEPVLRVSGSDNFYDDDGQDQAVQCPACLDTFPSPYPFDYR